MHFLKLYSFIVIISALTACGGGGGEQAGAATENEADPLEIISDQSSPVDPATDEPSSEALDSDGDGMTDAAEIKYGYDPNNSDSFPQTPAMVSVPANDIAGGATGAFYLQTSKGIVIRWQNPSPNTYSLRLKTEGSSGWDIYYGGHNIGDASVNLVEHDLKGDEILVGSFSLIGEDLSWIEDYSEFTIDLSQLQFDSVPGAAGNRLSYSFLEGFPELERHQYSEFLRRLFPLLEYYLGPPTESFDLSFEFGDRSGSFITLDDGRRIVTDASFIPRLIAHEIIHAWSGSYTITTDENWNYDSALSGFEEGLAEGVAFELIHEYVRSYPGDEASLKLLGWKPYQYWSHATINYDALKFSRYTGAGNFWTDIATAESRYSIAATTVQLLLEQNPYFFRDFRSLFHQKLASDNSWRSNRSDIIDMWATVVPTINGIDLVRYLDALPVFQGYNLDPGLYVLTAIRPYGTIGDQQYAIAYGDGSDTFMFGINDTELALMPDWLKADLGDDGYYYIDIQDQRVTVNLYHSQQFLDTFDFRTSDDRKSDGTAAGFGWIMNNDLDMEKFPIGLYREEIEFTDLLVYDSGAKDTAYFFGIDELDQSKEDYVLLVGIDGINTGSVTIEGIGNQLYISSLQNGAAVITSSEWPENLQGEISITVENDAGRQHSYKRTILEAGTLHEYYQHQFIIIDVDFNGVEDAFEK